MKELVLELSIKDKETLGWVRCIPDLKIATEGESIWVRGIDAQQYKESNVLRLPALNTYVLETPDNLFPLGSVTPIGKLKALDWSSIIEFLPLELPTSALPAQVEQKYIIRLVPSNRSEEGKALLSNLSIWKSYVSSAPEIRLQHLHFAVSSIDQVLISGAPMPAIPGKEYWEQNNILLPCGWDFEIPFISNLIADKLNPIKDSILLFDTNGEWEKIPLNSFVPATRSAVRLTKGSLSHE